MIALINYGMGNLRSVEKVLENLKYPVEVTDDPEDVDKAKAVILPGVGSFADCMKYLREKKLDFAISENIKKGKPYLGICLGLQILFEKSFEGGVHKGLEILKGNVRKLPKTVRVPHMGWNKVNTNEDRLFNGINKPVYAYFVHSYYADTDENILCTTKYGIDFCSGIVKDKMYGLQFHPEKSGDQGMVILKNFVEIANENISGD